eukprot:4590344-Prymnesium_polylepis.1
MACRRAAGGGDARWLERCCARAERAAARMLVQGGRFARGGHLRPESTVKETLLSPPAVYKLNKQVYFLFSSGRAAAEGGSRCD